MPVNYATSELPTERTSTPLKAHTMPTDSGSVVEAVDRDLMFQRRVFSATVASDIALAADTEVLAAVDTVVETIGSLATSDRAKDASSGEPLHRE